MKISDLKLGQIGYYSDGYSRKPNSVKFVNAIIDKKKYCVCFWNGQIEIKENKKDFFGTFGIFCNSPNSEQYNKNYQCFLTEQEVLDYNHNQIINYKIKKLEQEKQSLLQIKLNLLKTEKEILEIDFEKEKLELTKKLK